MTTPAATDAPHLLTTRIRAGAWSYALRCPHAGLAPAEGQPVPRCQAGVEEAGVGCLAQAHLVGFGLPGVWAGPPADLTPDMPVDVAWDGTGRAQLTLAAGGGGRKGMTPEDAARELAEASRYARYSGDCWRVLLDEDGQHHVELAYAKAVARSTQDQETRLRMLRDLLLRRHTA